MLSRSGSRTEQSSSSVTSTTARMDPGRRKPALRPSAWPPVPNTNSISMVLGTSALSIASSCCSKPQPPTPCRPTQLTWVTKVSISTSLESAPTAAMGLAATQSAPASRRTPSWPNMKPPEPLPHVAVPNPAEPMSLETIPTWRFSMAGKSCTPSPSTSPVASTRARRGICASRSACSLRHGVGVVDHEQHVDVAVGLVAAVLTAARGADERAREVCRCRDGEPTLDAGGARDVGVALARGPEHGGGARIAAERHTELHGGGEGQALGFEAHHGPERGEPDRCGRVGDDDPNLGRLAQRAAGDPELQVAHLQQAALGADQRARAHAGLRRIERVEMRLAARRKQRGERDECVSTRLHHDSFERRSRAPGPTTFLDQSARSLPVSRLACRFRKSRGLASTHRS